MSDIELLYKTWQSCGLFELQVLCQYDFEAVLFDHDYLPALRDLGLIEYKDDAPPSRTSETGVVVLSDVIVTELGQHVYKLSMVPGAVDDFPMIEALADRYGVDAVPDLNQVVLACAKKIGETAE